ncbi:MAG: hypothetical protein K2P59_02080, partial [Acetatifactor sp.]|nr:hypothetical protein [Acetatifactor sp.]
MKRKLWTKMTACGMALLMAAGLAACGGDSGSAGAGSGGNPGNTGAGTSGEAGGNGGISEDSPYADKGVDLSQREIVVMYAIGEKPTDMDKVMQVVNEQYLEPWLNTTLEVKFLSWGEMGDK